MSKSENSNYQTLADFARLIGVDRSTVLAWVRAGRLKTNKKNSKSKKRHRLNDHLFYHCDKRIINTFQKPYPKYSTPWSETEIYVLKNWNGSDKGLAKAVGRSVNAVRIKRSRLNF